ncbi:GNAT family N-acetyltransferase [Nocardioides litoris]|uniref:GNAT family N-acetyltransferase n=1 Tax=Nocardioides litoris TaxID=1926648 RepID=UPI00111FD80A|nr:GNAT family N-acetyltransferase [Nocardioides litoris]
MAGDRGDGALRERVLEASASGLWQPPDSVTTDTGHGLLVQYPSWAYTRLVLARFAVGDAADVGAALDRVLEAARGLDLDDGVDEVTCEVVLGSPTGYADALAARGSRVVDTVDVLALDLTAPLPDPGPVDDRVGLAWVDDVELARGFAEVARAGFGGEPSTEERLVANAAEGRRTVPAGEGGRAVALLDGRVVAGGGVTVEGEVARLWGAAALPEHRGIGAYRAVLHERLRHARDHGATLALVKGRIATSGPILLRYGFAAFGREDTHQLPLGGRPGR